MLPQKSVRHEEISIHALREEGDALPASGRSCTGQFLSTPSARRATQAFFDNSYLFFAISIHALREEGDPFSLLPNNRSQRLLPTPSARSATCEAFFLRRQLCISIHALREEGDNFVRLFSPT